MTTSTSGKITLQRRRSDVLCRLFMYIGWIKNLYILACYWKEERVVYQKYRTCYLVFLILCLRFILFLCLYFWSCNMTNRLITRFMPMQKSLPSWPLHQLRRGDSWVQRGGEVINL